MRTPAILTCVPAALMAAGLPTKATAASSAPSETRKLRATAEQMLGLSEQMVRAGKTVEAEQILQLLARDPNPDVRSEARYRHAILLEARGEVRDAAVLLRRALEESAPARAPRSGAATDATDPRARRASAA